MEQRQLIIDDEQTKIFKVNRSAFVDMQILALERKRIFDKCWIYVGHDSEVKNKNDYKTRNVCGRPVIFCRDNDGAVQVFLNSCTHRGAKVCREREGNTKVFRCFYHAWSFNNKGELVGVPGVEAYGSCFDKADMGLHKVPRLEHYNDFYFINFDINAVSLDEYLAGAKEYLDLVVEQSPTKEMEVIQGSQEYDTKANWKLLVENSFDGYHLLPTHKTYVDYLKESNLVIKQTNELTLSKSVAKDLGNGHAVIDSQTYRGRPVAFWMPMYGEDAKEEIEEIKGELVKSLGQERAERVTGTNRNLIIFPNLVINDGSAVTIRTFYPSEPNYMKVSAWALGTKGETETARSRRLYGFLSFYGPASFATPDDVAALESCQEGFETWQEVEWSDISRGIGKSEPDFNSTDEHQMRAFWRRWNELITEQVDL